MINDLLDIPKNNFILKCDQQQWLVFFSSCCCCFLHNNWLLQNEFQWCKSECRQMEKYLTTRLAKPMNHCWFFFFFYTKPLLKLIGTENVSVVFFSGCDYVIANGGSNSIASMSLGGGASYSIGPGRSQHGRRWHPHRRRRRQREPERLQCLSRPHIHRESLELPLIFIYRELSQGDAGSNQPWRYCILRAVVPYKRFCKWATQVSRIFPAVRMTHLCFPILYFQCNMANFLYQNASK